MGWLETRYLDVNSRMGGMDEPGGGLVSFMLAARGLDSFGGRFLKIKRELVGILVAGETGGGVVILL